MKWFERHLNWTAIIVTVCGFIFICLTILFALGFHWIERIYFIPNSEKTLLIMVSLFSTLSVVIGMLWIMLKKQVNILNSLFFTALISFAPMLFFALFSDELPGQYGFNINKLSIVLIFLLLFWIVGLIIILLKKNKKPDSLYSTTTNINKQKGNNKSFLTTLITSASLTVIFSLISLLNMNFGTQSIVKGHSGHLDGEHSYILRFDCPIGFFEACNSDPYETGNHLWFKSIKMRPFQLIDTDLQIHYYLKEDEYNTYDYSNLTETAIHLYFISNDSLSADIDMNMTYSDEYKNPQMPVFMKIDNRVAEYSSFRVNLIQYPKNSEANVKMVCFEDEESIWSIMYIEEDPTTNSEFDRILESFRIPWYIGKD